MEEQAINILESENAEDYTNLDEKNFSLPEIEGFWNFVRNLKSNCKTFYKNIKKHINFQSDKSFTNIVYLTTECPLYMSNVERMDSPVDFIFKIRNQYPDNNICLLIPIIGLSKDTKISKKFTLEIADRFYELERTSINFNIFSENRNWECSLYRFSQNELNIKIYGIYSPSFSYLKNIEELKTFEKLISFMKAVRSVVKNLGKEGFKPDIVHSETLPFYLGVEFEPKFPANIKVLQVFENFAKMEREKQEAFWSAINLVDKEGMKKICSDIYIQNCFARLFNLPVKEILPKMGNCINLIYENYRMFHNSEVGEYKNHGDIIFRHLNNRIKKLFPAITLHGTDYYYPFLSSLSNCAFWAVYSKTYYSDLYSEGLASPQIMKEIIKTTDKSGYVQPVISIEDYLGAIESKTKNKKLFIKEFSSDSIKTDFINKTMFKNPDNIKIYGYLDSFYDAPLLFANPKSDIFEEGIDILFSAVLKLFERNRNIQFIISMKDGLKNNYVKSFVEFLQNNKIFMGRWVYVDGEFNLNKIFSAADIYLYPARFCDKSLNHVLGIKYGCVPIVSNAGILNDTVIDIFDNISDGNGFKTKESLLREDENTNIYIDYIEKALEVYNTNPSSWGIIIRNGQEFNKENDFLVLEHYNNIYKSIL